MTDHEYMLQAMEEAKKARDCDEVPVGAIIVKNSEIIAVAHNYKEYEQTALAHAEMIAIHKANQFLGTWHLEDCTMYVTKEPCIMCTGAIINSRIGRIVIGATEKRWPAMITLLNDHEYNHKPEIVLSDLKEECTNMISQYFRNKRTK